MKHRSRRKRKILRKVKNLCGFQWCGAKNPEVWFGKLGRWLACNNKGKKPLDDVQDLEDSVE